MTMIDDAPQIASLEDYGVRTRKFNKLRSALFRSVNRVPSSLQASLITGLSGLFFAFVSLWAKIDHLNQWGTFGMRFGLLLFLALPLAVTALSLSTSHRLKMWRALGMLRMVLTTSIGVTALVLSVISAYVMYNALP